MSDTAYVSVHGLVLTDLVDIDGVSPAGSGRKVDSASSSGMSYATILDAGWEPETYSFEMHSATRASLERARQELNTAPIGAEFCPFTEDQCAYLEYACAGPAKSVKLASGQQYYSDAVVICRNGLLYGSESGIAFQRDVPLPKTATITNNGYYTSGLDCLTVSGGYAAPDYVTDLQFSIDENEVALISHCMRGGRLVLDRWGNCNYSYETHFKKIYTEQQIDLGGSTFLDYGTSGALTTEALTIGANGKMVIPFYGPLPVSGCPHLTIEVDALAGAPDVEIAYSSDLSDLEAIDCDALRLGTNEIDFPEDALGESFVAIGITTGAGANITLSHLKASVDKYVGINDLPVIDPGETATLTVSDGESSSHLLSYCLATYRDIF